MIEQDHRRIKQRIGPMLGFKRFDSATVTISGIELVQKIKKHQFKTRTLGGSSATMLELWNAVAGCPNPQFLRILRANRRRTNFAPKPCSR
jgi:DDE domain